MYMVQAGRCHGESPLLGVGRSHNSKERVTECWILGGPWSITCTKCIKKGNLVHILHVIGDSAVQKAEMKRD